MVELQKRKIWWVISLFLVMLYFSGLTAQAQYGGGSGAAHDPYLIYTAEQMNEIGLHEEDWDKHFILMADIDLSAYTGTEFNIIGIDWDNAFTGVFNGSGHTISNFSYTSTDTDQIGLFGYVVGENALIKDLGLIDPNVDAGTGRRVGSLVGWLRYGTITDCYVEGGSVSGTYDVGGLVGCKHYGKAINCYSTGAVSGRSFVGGLVGRNGGDVTQCYSTAVVSGDSYVGGLVGYNYEGSVLNCYSTGAVSGDDDVGGLVGYNRSGSVLNCYSTGSVSGNERVGGLVGRNGGAVTECYNTGTVNGTGYYVGGLVGSGDPDRVLNSFWDIETSGLTGSSGGAGLTTAEMMDPEILGLNGFGGDPNWVLDNGRDYPRLVWEGTPGEMIPEPVVDWLDGSGTPEDPFQIENADQLLMLHEYSFLWFWDKHFVLNSDIDLDPNLPGRGVFEQAVIPVFWGSFVGNGHVILNLQIEGGNDLGLFGKLNEGSMVRDLGLENISVHGTEWSAGGLVGSNYGSVLNCYSTGAVSGNERVGGLVGWNGGDVTQCYSTAVVSGISYVGGLVGSNGGEVINCSSKGSVSGNERVGGLVGYNYDGTVVQCYCTGAVSGTGQFVGGLVGFNNGITTNCYSTGAVCGDRFVGGLVGLNYRVVTQCFWDTWTSGQATSYGGTGKTTAEMQLASTFLEAGWDFVGETENGTEDIWWILEGQGYPSLVELPEVLRLRSFPAFCPHPKDGATYVVPLSILHWAPAYPTLQHDIYLGEDNGAVANATTLSLGIYCGRQPGEVTAYDPGPLEWGKTYYWRIDEYNTDETISKGDVWSFTTANFLLVDDFESYNDLDPDYPESKRIWNTWIDGFDDWENGSIVGYEGWESIETRIVHGGSQSMPYFYNTNFRYSEATLPLVWARDWTQDGVGVLSLWFYGDPNNAPERMYVAIANANGVTGMVYHNDPNAPLIKAWMEWRIDLQEFAAQGVNLTDVNTLAIGFGDMNNLQAGGSGLVFFDDIRLYRPLPAFSPDPQDGATDVIQSPILHWVPAEPTLQHDIYLGEDKELVANATTESPGIYRGRQAGEMTTYDPGTLELGKAYYWRIDECSTDVRISKGNVWSFTTANFLVVDDFESYNDYEPDRIFDIWIVPWDLPIKGSIVGYAEPPFTEQTIVHGGNYSMPLFYDNSGPAYYSEAVYSPTQRDWTEQGVGLLSLWFYGDPNNAPASMYVAIANSGGTPAMVYHDNPNAAQIEAWTEWTIDLTKFSDQGVDLTDVDTIFIGFGDKNNLGPGGEGLVFFDDIRLYRPVPEPEPAQ